MQILASKDKLRRQIKKDLQKLAAAEKKTRSGKIRQYITGYINTTLPRQVGIYLHLADEPDIDAIVVDFTATGATRISAPKIVGQSLQYYPLESLQKTEVSRYRIREPAVSIESVKFSATDMVLVPGLAFTENGLRLGHGKGYFDRFLAGFPGLSVGVCFSRQILTALPVQDHDRRVKMLITDLGLWDVSRRQFIFPE